MDRNATTSYGTWNNRVDEYAANFATSVCDALGDYPDDYDLDGLTAAYKAAINNALPARITLTGDEFIGPAYVEPGEFDGYPHRDGRLDLKKIVKGVDFWDIASGFDQAR